MPQKPIYACGPHPREHGGKSDKFWGKKSASSMNILNKFYGDNVVCTGWELHVISGQWLMPQYPLTLTPPRLSSVDTRVNRYLWSCIPPPSIWLDLNYTQASPSPCQLYSSYQPSGADVVEGGWREGPHIKLWTPLNWVKCQRYYAPPYQNVWLYTHCMITQESYWTCLPCSQQDKNNTVKQH